jgi:hypothetical protein
MEANAVKTWVATRRRIEWLIGVSAWLATAGFVVGVILR